MKVQILFFPLIFLLANNTFALPLADSVPGGISIVPLQIEHQIRPKAYFKERRLMVIRQQSNWHALVGIPLSTKPGAHQIRVIPGEAAAFNLGFEVKPKEYDSQYITIKKKRQVNPNPEDLKRIRSEKAEMLKVYRSWSSEEPDLAPFRKPAQGPYSSPFGLRRFFNNQARSPHSGIDIAAPQGSDIIAPSKGAVRALGHYFFNGKTVLLDHGQGLVSMFCHMDSISVVLGQEVERGQLLGTVGKTGRSTGPHLHWTVSLNNARVNPLLFLAE